MMTISTTTHRPPKAVREAMNDELEIQTFEVWRSQTGAELHHELSGRAQYDRQRAEWKGIPTDELEKVLRSVQELDPAVGVKGCTWDDLIHHVNHAVEIDEQKNRNSKLRSISRRSKADLECLRAFVKLIPEEKGLSLLRDGLSIIFQSWIQRIETREKVLGLLSDVVELFAHAVAQRQCFQDDVQLGQLLRDLYGVMIDAVRGLIDVLLRTHKGSLVQRIRKQLPTHEAEKVKEIVTTIEIYKTKLSDKFKNLSLERDAIVYQNSETIKREVQTTRYQLSTVDFNVREINYDMRATRGGVERLYDQGQETNAQFETMARQFVQWKEQFSSELGIIKQYQTLLYQMMGEKIFAEKLGWLPRPSNEHQRLEYHRLDIPLAQLATQLNVDPTAMLHETHSTIQKASVMDPDGLTQVRGLVLTVQFHDWMSLPFPSVLLVDGNCRDMGLGRTSPLSVFCASLAATLAHSDSNIVLHFFCGQHNNSCDDPVGGPSGMLRSLIAQLILYPNVVTTPTISMEQNLWEGISKHDVPALVALLEQILVSLNPSKTIYCILDSISDYQSAIYNWTESILYVLRTLHRIADERRPGPRLKLLMTSANRTRDIHSIVNQEGGEYVALRPGNFDDRPMRGLVFEQDIRGIMQAPRDAMFLDPLDQFGRRSFGGDAYVSMERPRSVGRFV